jgi:Zn-dependent protease with chaperone function
MAFFLLAVPQRLKRIFMNETFGAAVFLKEPKIASRLARLSFELTGLRIESENLSWLWPYTGLSFNYGGDDHQFLIVTSPGIDGPFDSLVVNDPLLVHAFMEHCPEPNHTFLLKFEGSRRKALSAKWGQMALVVLLGLALAGGLLWGVQKYFVREVVKHTPVKTEVSWGGQLAKLYLSDKKEIKQGPSYNAAQVIWKRLNDAAKSNNPGYPLVLHLVKDETVNAFALPGGQVVLFTGLMEKAEKPEEVAGVLAHEIQHVLKRHATARIAQSIGSRTLVSILFGGSDLGALTMTAQQLGELSYGRGQESEADAEGAKLMAKAGLPVSSLGVFFQRLESTEGSSKIPGFISTHPDSHERAMKLSTLAKTLRVQNPRPLPIDWTLVQKDLTKLP